MLFFYLIVILKDIMEGNSYPDDFAYRLSKFTGFTKNIVEVFPDGDRGSYGLGTRVRFTFPAGSTIDLSDICLHFTGSVDYTRIDDGTTNAIGEVLFSRDISTCISQLTLYSNGKILQQLTVGVACGTGATLAGLAASADAGQQIVIGFPVLKAGGFIRNEAEALLVRALGILPSSIDNRMQLYLDAHCGGYAKMNPRLIAFMRRFHDTTGVKLDPIYTAKLLLGIYDMAEARLLHERARHHLPSLVDTDARDEAVVNVLAVHTGGLQGLKGVEEKIGEKIF